MMARRKQTKDLDSSSFHDHPGHGRRSILVHLILAIRTKPNVFLALAFVVAASFFGVYTLNTHASTIRYAGARRHQRSAQEIFGYALVDPDDCGTDTERVINVFRWAKKHGAFIHPNITTKMFPIPGKPLLSRSLTFSLDLSDSKIKHHHVLGQVYNDTIQLHDAIGALAVFLLLESQNKSSFWRPYLCSLPKHVPLPMFYSKERRQQLKEQLPEDQRVKFDALVEARRDVVDLHYMQLLPVLFLKYPTLFSPEVFSYEKFAWAISIIMSRTWGKTYFDSALGPRGRNITVHTLAPAADMPNHDSSGLEANRDPRGRMTLNAQKNLSVGEQFFISYGSKCDAEFLAHYGFVPFNNSHKRCKGRVYSEGDPNMGGHDSNVTAWRKKWRKSLSLYHALVRKARREGKDALKNLLESSRVKSLQTAAQKISDFVEVIVDNG
ncbi:hypothetical protein GUITHDRAFT_110913 [Guillardia theta CCMP2712]|uniref:SET domain-containing protein n=1 Tax=Guillardia theta (strain CCMP2712) TaxID=905079 RepID=L1J3U2_GUITC|nr:hypothetical protein GUITHDRAFT_110913 [Guillardia theta CCMP2712]EKX43186.1 hypothetical protein GUITHDRAFT_110913 [Guillardia theta CCMP2712]|eukprot:XP_005830166.1 hypothetical protein GUITHDRAFT_110913 [Guillardia theta CCMP2712]